MLDIMQSQTREVCDVGSYQPPTVMNQLQERRSKYETKLAEINDAIAALEKNPEFARCLDIVGKAIRN